MSCYVTDILLIDIFLKKQFQASIEQFYIFLIMLLEGEHEQLYSCSSEIILQVICPNNLNVDCWQAVFLSKFQQGLA